MDDVAGVVVQHEKRLRALEKAVRRSARERAPAIGFRVDGALHHESTEEMEEAIRGGFDEWHSEMSEERRRRPRRR